VGKGLRRSVFIFTLPQESPCGSNSSCCGPPGQSEQVVDELKTGLHKVFGVPVSVINVKDENAMQDYRGVDALIENFGCACTPVVALGLEVVCMGKPNVEDVVAALKTRMNCDCGPGQSCCG